MKTLFKVEAAKKGIIVYRAFFEVETDCRALELGRFYAGHKARGAKWKVSEVGA